MPDVTIASFNVKNLIGADREYYRFMQYSANEHSWKSDWLAEQVVRMDADVVGFQEIFELDALQDVIAQANAAGTEANADHMSGRISRVLRSLKYKGYDLSADQLAFAPNSNDGAPGQRRPGVATLSRFGFAEPPEIIQDLAEPVEIAFSDMGGGDGGLYRMSRTSRPILKTRIPMGRDVVTVFNCHLKSKLGEFVRPADGGPAPEADLTQYDAVGRALGAARAAMRRMAEAWVLRRAVVAELEQGRPVMVLGDFNDSEHAVSTEIISGEAPFKNYSYMLRHDAKDVRDRYSREENETIRENVEAMRLHSAETLFARKSLRDMVYTSTFGGIYESIDQIFLSRHFVPEAEGKAAGSHGAMEYFTILNDHLNDGSHPDAPHNKLISDHGQIMVHLALKG